MRLRKYRFLKVARIVAMFFIGLLVSVAITLSQINLEALRDEVTNTLSEAVGMPVEIRGKIYWKFSLTPKIALTDVAVKSKDWAKNKDGVSIDLVEAKLSLISLFSSNPSVRDVVLINPIVYLEKNAKSEISLESKRSFGSESAEDALPKFPIDTDWGIDSVRMENPKLVLINPNKTEEFKADQVIVNYDKKSHLLEYTGRLVLNDQDYSFIASLYPLDTKRKVYPVRVAIVNKLTPLTANIALEQTSRLPIDFVVRGKISDAAGFFQQFGIDIVKLAPMTINIAGGVDNNRLVLRQSSILFGKSDLSISGSYSWGLKRPEINLKLKSQRFSLDEVFPDLYGGDTPWQRPDRELHVFKNVPLNPDYLNAVNAEIIIDFAKMEVYRSMLMENVNAHLGLHDGSLSLNIDNQFANGQVEISLLAHENSGAVFARAAARGKGVVIGKILESVDERNFIAGLPADFEFYVEGNGRDLSELMSNLNGPVQVKSVGAGTALPDAAEYIYGRDFLTSVRHSVQDIVMAQKKYDKVAISCALVNLKLRQGRAETDQGIALQTRDVNMRAMGFVDLGKEDMHVSLASTPVRGIRLSITGSIVNAMEFTGNLAEPDIKLNNGAMISRAATTAGIGMLVLAPFTGGLSLVAGAGVGFLAGDLLNNWLTDERPCETALMLGAPAREGDPAFMNRPLEELVAELIK